MPTSANGYICNRCWQRLTRSTATQPSRQYPKFYHSSAVHLQEAALRPAQSPDTSSPDLVRRTGAPRDGSNNQPRPQGWRALLRNKSLGEAASILVLRDTEQKRNGRRQSTNHEREERDVIEALDAGQILSSLKDQNSSPKQSEVNSSINSLRPNPISYRPSRLAIVSQKEYEKILKQLSDGFNQAQLARYITSELGRNVEVAQSKPPDPVESKSGMHISDWRPPRTGTDSRGKKKNRSGISRGKRGLAESILRSIWKLDVKEEIESEGSIDIRVDPQRLSLAVLGESGSELSELGRTINIRIEIIQSKNTIRLFAGKERCIDAAREIGLLLQEPATFEMDLRPIRILSKQKHQPALDGLLLKTIAEHCECTLDLGPRGEKVTVRARERLLVENFQRLLLACFDLRIRCKDMLVSNQDHESDGHLIAAPSGLATDASQLLGSTLGRYTMPFSLAPGDHGAPKQLLLRRVPDPVSNKICKHIQQSALFGISSSRLKAQVSKQAGPGKPKEVETETSEWGPIPRTRISAHFGLLLHPVTSSNPVCPMTTDQLIRASRDRLVLAPAISGLPLLLEQHLDLERITNDVTLPQKSGVFRSEQLDVQLVPSPWTMSRAALRGLPSLDLTVIPNYAADAVSPLQIRSLSARMGTRCANIMAPTMGLDLRLLRSDFLDLHRPESSPALQDYLKRLHESSSDSVHFGQIHVPLSVTLPVPTVSLIPGAVKNEARFAEALKSEDSVVLVDFIAVSHQHMSTLSIPYGSHTILYRHVLNDEFGHSWESVDVHADAEGSTEDGDVDMENEVVALFESAQALHKSLNIGIGKISRVGDWSRKVQRASKSDPSIELLGT